MCERKFDRSTSVLAVIIQFFFGGLFFFALDLQPSNGLFLSALLVVLPLESLAHGLFHELGSCLGGTCVGYALVIPTAYCR